MALTVLSVIPDAASLDVRILATDLNPHVVAHGKNGVYEREELRDVPPNLRAKWFEPVTSDGRGTTLKIADEVQSLVSFRQLNLMGTWPINGPFDAIFCRNVVIYFDRETQSIIWNRLTRLLGEQGALYIGHSERISGPATALLSTDGVTSYRRKGSKRS
jgi:chemotaxis protein methyltransferase CheR